MLHRHPLYLRVLFGILCITTIASGCDDPGDEPPQVTGTTNPIPAATRAAQLLDELASGRAETVFDHRYAVFLGDGAALFIGTRADTAVAYYCNPTAGSAWMGGSNDRGQLQLVGTSGAGFVGGIVGSKVTGKLSGTRADAGDVSLVETTDTVLTRDASAANRESSGRIAGPSRSCG